MRFSVAFAIFGWDVYLCILSFREICHMLCSIYHTYNIEYFIFDLVLNIQYVISKTLYLIYSVYICIYKLISPNYSVAQGRFPTHRGGRVRDLSNARLGELNQQQILREIFGVVFFGKIRDSQLGKLRKYKEFKRFEVSKMTRVIFYKTLSLSGIFNNSFRRTYRIFFFEKHMSVLVFSW